MEAGQRVGLIRFGSRVDVYLPPGPRREVLLGQRSIAGETVLAEIGVDIAADGHQPVNEDEGPRGIPFRAMIPNAITALALCMGLTGVSLAIRRRMGKGARGDHARRRSRRFGRPDRPAACVPRASSGPSWIR